MEQNHNNNFLMDVKGRSDRLMNYFLAAYFITGIALAPFFGTWLIAIGSGTMCLLAYYSTRYFLPQSPLYQYVLGAVFGIFMAQFIYQMHGLFEMHFFAFIGSAMLITYQNWKLQLPMLIVVMVHHALFGYLQNSGLQGIYFTRLDYFDITTFIIHIVLSGAIFFICGLWAYQLNKYTQQQVQQAIKLTELSNEVKLTAEKLKGEELLEERNSILESIGDGFFSVDPNWVLTYWNRESENIMQLPREQVVGQNLWELFPEARHQQSWKEYHKAMDTGVAVHFEDYFPPTASWYEVSAYPSLHGLAVYFKNINERKQHELQLQSLNATLAEKAKELTRSNTDLEQFAYSVSHDLQEPLRMVSSFLARLEKKYNDALDEKGRQYIHFAVDGAARMRELILSLLDYSRANRTPYEVEDVDIESLIHDVIVLLRKTIEESGAVITNKNLPAIHIAKVPVQQIFQNLISNAIKYRRSGMKPEIEITFDPLTQIFCVSDNGIGVEPGYHDQIFGIFKRLHTHEEYPGTGIGLAVTKKLVEHLGGRIWLESDGETGSRFYFSLNFIN